MYHHVYNLQHTVLNYDFILSSNHCWVSFTGFSEAYNDVYENSIEKHATLFTSVDNMETEGINNFSLSENNSRIVLTTNTPI